ncbi:CRISPR-associated helicase Cas3' [Thiomicrorhabdus heinhorstiae]|uniref:CRISPR-associated helicase Cas3 n=1 Tax=Thiomicrorhabdus heinhorstiae TaxID=2748010 RepID=A0ABS0BV52_9GAMM|nr:CRISPR-associated helicase Cas3' [Thiomicrorhabdus heinhorstiae]MBF6057703.1 CRISPR-associated helicase Cas3' [Thiomicrorhabdus heinhorstiae]
MMVMFVSQCEKKALPRTRRVLDSFANRIGDNTWQTVITIDGLEAVKRLLRKTATKNTAVSCHWLRSRSRIDLQWIVGSKQKFNEQGHVPVNYTTKDILVRYDESINPIYANTKGQLLKDHLYAVGWVAQALVNQLYPDVPNLRKVALIAGLWHDIGKLDPKFQEWLNKELKRKTQLPIDEDGVHIDKGTFSFEKHPRHNEISLALFNLLTDGQARNLKPLIEHVIYWHHAKPIRKSDFNYQIEIWSQLSGSLGAEASSQQLTLTAKSLMKELYQSFETLQDSELNSIDFEDVDAILKQVMPEYKLYSDKHNALENFTKDITENAKKDIIRTAVISADRAISALDADELAELISEQNLNSVVEKILDQSSHLQGDIEGCIDRFNKPDNAKRNEQQTIAADQLTEVESVVVLEGPAGCGKTKIALEWAAKKNVQKLIWVCPRVQVCLGIYDELKSDQYLPETKIELLTGEFKKTWSNGQENETPDSEQFGGQIVITTIDQVMNTITTHRQVTGLIEFLNSHVVFDEFHELIKIPALNLLFAELVKAKSLREHQANCLLVSATINPLFVTEVLETHKDDIVSVETFNQSDYQIQFKGYDETTQDSPLVSQTYPPNTFVISNTAKAAQLGFIRHQTEENAILFHGRYTKKDKREIFEQVYNAFKKEGTREFDILRSGPIVQASLNITCDEMHTEITSPENWLQRLGRLDRFGQSTEKNVYVTYLPNAIKEYGKQKNNVGNFLNKQFEFQSAYQWFLWLDDKLQEMDSIKLSWLYQQYRAFYKEKSEQLTDELHKLLQKSAVQLNHKLHDPIAFKSKPVKKDAIKIKASSLRGDSRFVQMAEVQFDENGEWHVTDEYTCNTEIEGNQFTMSIDEIQGYDESGENNLINFMYKKHHQIQKFKGEKYAKRYKAYLLKNEATDASTPIFLSYTEQDLALCNETAHAAAIYYAQGIKQPIGAIAIHKLENTEEE